MQVRLNPLMTDTLAKRVKFARSERKLTQDQLSRYSGIKQSDISKIERGDTLKPTGLLALARALSCNPHWLDTGDGKWNEGLVDDGFHSSAAALDAPDNFAAVRSRGRVPLISWVTAGLWVDIADNFAPGEADDWIEPSETRPSRHAFALTVVGDSMTSPYTGGDSVTFPAGTIIIVDPDQSADAGHFVVAKDVETQKATFKKLMYDGGRWYLKPLNPEYKTVEIDDPAMRVIGRVVEFQGKRGKL
jgi:SOS-response transcriptional repressor LexA